MDLLMMPRRYKINMFWALTYIIKIAQNRLALPFFSAMHCFGEKRHRT